MTVIHQDLIKKWDETCYNHVRGLVRLVAELLEANGFTKVDIVDVGANVGTFTDKLNDFVPVRKAMLIEPVEELMDFIKEKLGDGHIYVTSVASDEKKVVNFFVNDTEWNLGLSKVIPNVIEGQTREIETVTLTELLIKHDFNPDFIKIDAENHDLEVLAGLYDWLWSETSRPIINFECAGSQQPEEIIKRFESLGYKTYFIGDKLNSVEYFFMMPHLIPHQELQEN